MTRVNERASAGGRAEAGAGAMLVACRLAGLSALGDTMRASNDAQCGADNTLLKA